MENKPSAPQKKSATDAIIDAAIIRANRRRIERGDEPFADPRAPHLSRVK